VPASAAIAVAALTSFVLAAPPAAQTPPSAGLSAGQLAGQRIVLSYPGPTPPAGLVRRVRRGGAAGVILFARNVRSTPQVRRSVAVLQRAARQSPIGEPLLVMVDQEGGAVRRLAGGPARGAEQLRALGGERAVRAARADGGTAARALRRAGTNVDLAPVADLCRPGGAMAREGRCYGSRPPDVTRIAGAFADGVCGGRVAPALKHFPGFGRAGVNTDDAPATIRTPLARLRATDERPFRVLRRRAPLVMLSSAVYPALDARRPAPFSRAIAMGELRGRVGFRGVSITDDLETPAAARVGGPAARARLGARAGTDLLLFARSTAAGTEGADALRSSLRHGSLSRPFFRASVDRVLRLRARLGRRC
jgi:beta-N-acetylhexosaminidase